MTWYLVALLWMKYPVAIPMQSLNACLNAKQKYLSAFCINTETGDEK